MTRRAADPVKVLTTLYVLVLSLSAGDIMAQGVTVAPNRILLDGKTRAATVFLSNRGNETETYRISLTYFSMDENGSLVRVDSMTTSQEFAASEFLRYSPRRVVIPAGGSQTIRLLVRRPADLEVENKEYRAHLSVCSVPGVPRLLEVEEQPLAVGDDQILVKPVASVETLVPIVVRFGKPQAELAITEARLVQADPPATPLVAFSLERSGDRSVYGDLTLTHVDPAGKKTRIHFARGIAVYTPNPRRVFEIKPNAAGLDLLSGTILIDFRETAAGGGNLQAEAEIRPPQRSRQ